MARSGSPGGWPCQRKPVLAVSGRRTSTVSPIATSMVWPLSPSSTVLGKPILRAENKFAPRRWLFDDLVGAKQERIGHLESDGFGGLEVDAQIELGRLLDRQVARLGALEDLVDVVSGAAVHVLVAWPERHQPAGLHQLPVGADAWYAVRRGKGHERLAIVQKHAVGEDMERLRPLLEQNL